MANVVRSGGVVEELREIRKVMEELVGVTKKVASGLEKREAIGHEEEKDEVRRKKVSVVVEESRIKEERIVKEEEKTREGDRKVKVSSIRKGKMIELRKKGRERMEERVKIREEAGGERGEMAEEEKRRRGYGWREEEEKEGKGEEYRSDRGEEGEQVGGRRWGDRRERECGGR